MRGLTKTSEALVRLLFEPKIVFRMPPKCIPEFKEQLFDAGPHQLDEVHDSAFGDSHGEGAMRQHEDLGELAEDGIRRERGPERKLEKVLVGNKHVCQRDIVAAGALEAERVPGVPDLPVFGRAGKLLASFKLETNRSGIRSWSATPAGP
jgi:hypothetical protein